LDIELIKEKTRLNQFILSGHAHKERQEEEIEIKHIKEALLNGEIIENYPNDPRGPSCLISGFSENRPIHLVCGWTKFNWLLIVTVYIPKPPKWVDSKTRATKAKKGGE